MEELDDFWRQRHYVSFILSGPPLVCLVGLDRIFQHDIPNICYLSYLQIMRRNFKQWRQYNQSPLNNIHNNHVRLPMYKKERITDRWAPSNVSHLIILNLNCQGKKKQHKTNLRCISVKVWAENVYFIDPMIHSALVSIKKTVTDLSVYFKNELWYRYL